MWKRPLSESSGKIATKHLQSQNNESTLRLHMLFICFLQPFHSEAFTVSVLPLLFCSINLDVIGFFVGVWAQIIMCDRSNRTNLTYINLCKLMLASIRRKKFDATSDSPVFKTLTQNLFERKIKVILKIKRSSLVCSRILKSLSQVVISPDARIWSFTRLTA